MVRLTTLGVKGKNKDTFLFNPPARCVHCMLPYICQAWAWVCKYSCQGFQQPGEPFVSAQHITFTQEQSAEDVKQPSNLYYETPPSQLAIIAQLCTTVSTAQKYMQLEICLRNHSLKSYFHLKFLCIDTDPDYRLNPKANNTCTYT